jgi:hypothetical protein
MKLLLPNPFTYDIIEDDQEDNEMDDENFD